MTDSAHLGTSANLLNMDVKLRLVVDFGETPVPPEAMDRVMREVESVLEASNIYVGPNQLGPMGIIDEAECDLEDHYVTRGA